MKHLRKKIAVSLLSTAYKNEDFDGDGKADGRVYIYFTYNAKPGGIYYTYDAAAQAGAATESGVLLCAGGYAGILHQHALCGPGRRALL